jgi:ubiquinone biosynthesis protein
LHVESGWVPPDTPVPAFESTMRAVCEPIFQKPIRDISFGLLLLQLFRTASRFNMEVQPSLVLLQKTLLNIEGLGKQLYPDLDLWQTALPFLERWQKQRLSPLANLKKIRDRLPEWIEQAPDVPELVFVALQQAGTNRTQLQQLHSKVRELENRDRAQSGLRTFILVLLLVVVAVVSFSALSSYFSSFTLPLLIVVTGFFSLGYYLGKR